MWFIFIPVSLSADCNVLQLYSQWLLHPYVFNLSRHNGLLAFWRPSLPSSGKWANVYKAKNFFFTYKCTFVTRPVCWKASETKNTTFNKYQSQKLDCAVIGWAFEELNQNKKGQKNLGYPRKKQSFYKEKDCFFLGYPKFFGPSYFEAALMRGWHILW